ncbi:DoxX family protein [Fulvivirga sp. RKSG066]|uniref:DoxX family protein n=1 Tax=Fulvivirga aurantia TaxID=2529383 RepID=UPI0012BD28C8|nr:DoxX family protein [Fulvivirga aurantia]MTI22018.1 DoxX family protein [Fulvivirga aurantia]
MSFLRKSVKKKYNVDFGLLIFRLMVGGLMLTHGYGKFMKVIEGNMGFADPIGIGPEASLVLTAFAEFVCALLIMFGLLTRLASIPLIIAMAVAAFITHGSDSIGEKEMALLYLASFILLFYKGGGRYSLDRMFFK